MWRKRYVTDLQHKHLPFFFKSSESSEDFWRNTTEENVAEEISRMVINWISEVNAKTWK